MVSSPRTEAGFTLVELLVTMVILGIIMLALGAALFVGLRTTNDTQRSLVQSNGEQVLAHWLNPDVAASTGTSPIVPPIAAVDACGISGAQLSIRYIANMATFAANPATALPDTTAVYWVQADGATRWNLVRTTCGFVSSNQVLVRGIDSNGFTATKPLSGECSAPAPAVSLKAVVTMPESTQSDLVPAYSFTLCALRRAA